eukprot:scaffold2956_cov107-Skeletonema_dohrnii-CCMP3373.AAC.4
MANTVPTSSAQPSLTGEVVVIEPSNEMASCPDPACAPPAAAVASFDSVTKIAPTASSQDIVTAVSSDDSATEVASASTDDPTLKEENDAPVVHHPSASASAARVASAPGTSNNMIVNNSVDISAAVSYDDSTTEVTSAPTTDDPAVHEESVPPMVHRPSASNNDGILSAPGTAHDKSVKSGVDIAPSISSEESNMVAENTVSPDTLVTAPVSTNVGHIVHHPASGVVHTTATEKAAPSPAMAVSLSTTEAGGIMAKHIQGVSTATAPEEDNADQHAQAKKRKFEDQRKKRAKVPKDKDPNAPKKNLTAYMHYATRARANIASEDLQLKATEITSVVKSGWHNMSLQDRHYWNEKAAADKERYETELLAKYKKSDLGVAWQARLDRERKQVTSDSTFDTYAGTEKAEAPNAPKPFVSAFMHYDVYARDYIKPRHPQMEDAEVASVVQRGWNVMSAEARTYWAGVADADKVRYSRELSEYAEAIQESKK